MNIYINLASPVFCHFVNRVYPYKYDTILNFLQTDEKLGSSILFVETHTNCLDLSYSFRLHRNLY